MQIDWYILGITVLVIAIIYMLGKMHESRNTTTVTSGRHGLARGNIITVTGSDGSRLDGQYIVDDVIDSNVVAIKRRKVRS